MTGNLPSLRVYNTDKVVSASFHGGVFAITCTVVAATVAGGLDGGAVAGAVLERFERMCIFLRSAAKRLRILWTTRKI